MKHLYALIALFTIQILPCHHCDMPCTAESKFIFFARQRKINALKTMLSEGIDINFKDEDGNTPLHYAAWEGDTETTNFLLDNGAQIDARNNCGQTPLMKAVCNGRHCAAKLLADRCSDLNIQDVDGNTAIMLATFIREPKPSVDMAKILLNKKYGPNLKIKNENRDTALTLAAKSNRYYLVKAILDYMVNDLSQEDVTKILNQRNGDKSNALLISLENFNNDISNLLLDSGSKIEITNQFGNTPLMIAVLKENITLIERLLCMGANVNHQNDCGFTPLMFSVTNGKDKFALKLIDYGARLDIKNKNGETVIDIANSRKFREIGTEIGEYYEKIHSI